MESFKKFFRQWAGRRSKISDKVTLNHSTIYIVPSRRGLVFLLVVVVIWILGTNYQNNLILGFAFLLLSIMMVCSIHAFKNLLGLEFSGASELTAYAGEASPYQVILLSKYRGQHRNIILSLNDRENSNNENIYTDVHGGESTQVVLHQMNSHRGRQAMPQIRIKSYYPLGLMRVWSYATLNHSILVFPKPVASLQVPLKSGSEEEGEQQIALRGDEFYGFKNYEAGAPLSQIAWKQYARGAELLLKDYREYQSRSFVLDYSSIQSSDLEYRLSVLCYWVNHFSNQRLSFGLELPGVSLPVGDGDTHRVTALTILALYS